MSEDLKSRSQLKRVMATDPYVVIHEIERLLAEVERLREELVECGDRLVRLEVEIIQYEKFVGEKNALRIRSEADAILNPKGEKT